MNVSFGFSEECATRLGEDPNEDDSIFARVNRLFEWLPLAAVVEDKILCIHGGIGIIPIEYCRISSEFNCRNRNATKTSRGHS